MRKFVTAAAVFVGVTAMAVPAFAGEVTGGPHPKPVPAVLHANSICAFSGQNDTPNAEFPEGGRVQSFGQLVRKGVIDPREFNPGIACRGGSNTPEEPPA